MKMPILFKYDGIDGDPTSIQTDGTSNTFLYAEDLTPGETGLAAYPDLDLPVLAGVNSFDGYLGIAWVSGDGGTRLPEHKVWVTILKFDHEVHEADTRYENPSSFQIISAGAEAGSRLFVGNLTMNSEAPNIVPEPNNEVLVSFDNSHIAHPDFLWLP